MGNLLRTEKNCLNCGAEVTDTYCSHCGQKNVRTEITAFAAIGHLVADYFHADGKFFSTIPALLFRPGRLTIEYMAGRRKKYVDPFRLYIFCSILYFIVGALLSHVEDDTEAKEPAAAAEIRESAPHDSLMNITLAKADDDAGGINLNFTLPGEDLPPDIRAYEDSLSKLPEEDRPGWFTDLVLRQVVRINSKNGDWEEQFQHNLMNSIPKMMFFLIPVAALLLKLLYLRKKKFYLEHLVFQLHLHSFFFLFMLLAELTTTFIPLFSVLEYLIITWLLLYPLLGFVRNYRQGWIWSVVKYAFFLLTYAFCIIAGLAITAIITSYTT